MADSAAADDARMKDVKAMPVPALTTRPLVGGVPGRDIFGAIVTNVFEAYCNYP